MGLIRAQWMVPRRASTERPHEASTVITGLNRGGSALQIAKRNHHEVIFICVAKWHAVEGQGTLRGIG